MTINVLGGLVAENFVDNSENNKRRINIQKRLYDQGFTQGIQVRVGHDYTNRLLINNLIEKINSLGIPYIVHGPAENLGVDLGECFDECGKFGSYRTTEPNFNWKSFNKSAISNAAQVANGKLSLDSRVILHPGYSPNDKLLMNEYSERIKKVFSNELVGTPITLETIPSLVVEEDGSIPYYGFGGTAKEMQELLGDDVHEDGSVLIDFTHVGVTANQMKSLHSLFSNPQSYDKLMKDLLELGIGRFTHFSGHTTKLWDVHDGFIIPRALDMDKQKVVKDALKELNQKYSSEGVYVALEINFAELEKSKREIDTFRKQYT
jgi:hypothetical protein